MRSLAPFSSVVVVAHFLRARAVRIQPEETLAVANQLTDGVVSFHESVSEDTKDWDIGQDGDVGQQRNPAGCARLSRKEFDLDKAVGVFDKKDFKEMLFATNYTNRFGAVGGCVEANKKEQWCPDPQRLSLDNIASEELDVYLRRELEGTDLEKPLIVAVFQGSVQASAIGIQLASYLCGWERLGLLENRSAIFATSAGIAGQLRKLNPRARVLYHPGMEDAMEAVMKTSNLFRKNRIWKLGVAQLLLNLGRDVILSDLDMYFVRDPTPVFQDAAQRDGLEFAAMGSRCWLELNSGFLYYRNTAATKEMLRMALTTWRASEGCRDNDQYLLNCGFARAAIGGLNYRILPPADFVWASSHNMGGSMRCNHPPEQDATPRWLGDGLPYVWHTGGFSTKYIEQLDMFAAFDLVDIDASTGKCKSGRRGAKADAEDILRLSTKSCSTAPGGFVHAMCHGPCQAGSRKVDALVDSFSTMLVARGL